MLAQGVQQLQRHLFFVKGIAANGAAGGQVVAALGDDDARPQHARCVKQVEAVLQHDALLQLGDTGFVAGQRGAFALERVDQRGLAHIRYAANQHPHGLDHGAPVGRQLKAGLHQHLGRCRHAGVQPQCAGARQGVEVLQPQGRAIRVGQVLLVQHLERRFARCELGQHRVGAGAGQARIQQLDDHIDLLDALFDRLARQVHVPREPLDCHTEKTLANESLDCRPVWWSAAA